MPSSRSAPSSSLRSSLPSNVCKLLVVTYFEASTLAFIFLLAFDSSFPPILTSVLWVFTPPVDQWQWQPKSTYVITNVKGGTAMDLSAANNTSGLSFSLLARPYLVFYSGFFLFVLSLYNYWTACTRRCESAGEWLATHNPMGIEETDVWSGQWVGREKSGRSSRLPLDRTWASAELRRTAPPS